MKRIQGLAMAFLVFLVACGDNHSTDKPAITGNWKVVKAFRDSRLTGLLNGVYFFFGQDGKMRTNLPNTSPGALIDYEISQQQILQKSSEPLCYKIDSFSDSTMVLSFEMNNTPFVLHLIRASELNIPVQDQDTLQQ